MLASFPASMLNQKPSDLGILNRFKLDPSRSRQHVPTPPLPRLLDSSSQATEPDKFGLKAKE